MRPLILIAASGLAREVATAALAQGRYEVVGILDDNPDRVGDVVDGVKVLGSPMVLADYPDACVVLCTGRGSARAELAARLDLPLDRYATVVHPSVDVPASCSIGFGGVLLAGSVLTSGVRIGLHVVVMPNVTLTHDDVVDDYATLCAGVTLGGSVVVERMAYLGMAASVRQNVRIGAGATVGMGAVVLHDVAPESCVWGVPAQVRGHDQR